ncbi:unnamed protein product, partial [Mesorhabditis spiculigera]
VCSALSDYDYKGRDYVKEKADRLVFGLWGIKDLPKMLEVVDNALTAGYRTFDTAQAYDNEEITEPSLIESMKLLQVDYLDLVLIHWPGVFPVNQP